MSDLQIITNPQSLNGSLETWFVQNVIFDGAPYALEYDQAKTSSNVLVYLEFGAVNYEVINRIRASGKRMVLYQMGDELGQADVSEYEQYDLVIRNYYHSDIFREPFLSKKLLWAPNGFRTGVGPRDSKKIKSIKQRQGFAAFLGWLSNPNSYKNERISFAQAALACGHKLYVLPADKFAGGCNVGLYSAIMEDNIFAPCPAGNSPETIRLYDVLELGCIPILLKHEFLFSIQALGAIGHVPFVLLDSWDELPSFLNEAELSMKTNLKQWMDRQLLCIDWWSRYKSYISRRVLEKVQEFQ